MPSVLVIVEADGGGLRAEGGFLDDFDEGRVGGGIMQIAHAGSPAQVRAAERLLERTRRELYRILADDEDPDEEPDEEEQDV